MVEAVAEPVVEEPAPIEQTVEEPIEEAVVAEEPVVTEEAAEEGGCCLNLFTMRIFMERRNSSLSIFPDGIPGYRICCAIIR